MMPMECKLLFQELLIFLFANCNTKEFQSRLVHEKELILHSQTILLRLVFLEGNAETDQSNLFFRGKEMKVSLNKTAPN